MSEVFSFTLPVKYSDQRDFESYKEDELVIMQSTGLLDKNGKEVFEGDLVKFKDGSIAEIRWADHTACFFAGSKSFADRLQDEGGNDREIIGNTYEQPIFPLYSK